jgi:hypothetical protein
MQYLMLTNGTFESLASANAKAIHGLQPKINIWNTGAQGDSVGDPSAPIRNLFQSLPPLLAQSMTRLTCSHQLGSHRCQQMVVRTTTRRKWDCI